MRMNITSKFMESVSRCFVATVAVILGTTAIFKLITLVLGWSQLGRPDPLIFVLSNRYLLTMVVALELCVAITLLRSQDDVLKLQLVAWISTAFVAYRVGLFAIGHELKCFCLGRAESWLLWAREGNVDSVMKGVLVFMFIGSYSLLAFHLRSTPDLTASTGQSADNGCVANPGKVV